MGEWFCEVSDEADYLDGIMSDVTVFAEDRRPVAYAFNPTEGRLLAAAPALLDAISRFLDLGAHPDTYAALRAARAKASEG